MTLQERDQKVKEQQVSEAKKLLEKMDKAQAIEYCEQLAEKLPNINLTPPIHRMDDDQYQQFWRFGVVAALNAL